MVGERNEKIYRYFVIHTNHTCYFGNSIFSGMCDC